jgi:hypothetical protein
MSIVMHRTVQLECFATTSSYIGTVCVPWPGRWVRGTVAGGSAQPHYSPVYECAGDDGPWKICNQYRFTTQSLMRLKQQLYQTVAKQPLMPEWQLPGTKMCSTYASCIMSVNSSLLSSVIVITQCCKTCWRLQIIDKNRAGVHMNTSETRSATKIHTWYIIDCW